MGFGRDISRAMIAVAAFVAAAPALAQFSDSHTFLQAVRDQDGEKAQDFLNKPGAPVLNTRDPGTGETALHIVVKAHNDNWVAFLLMKGALTEIRDNQGNTPLLLAALVDDPDAITMLLSKGARVNAVNNNGETPLIMAVQRRDLVAIRDLLAAGADPKVADTISGKSARDYAAEDSRSAAIVKLLDDTKPSAPLKISGPILPH